MRKEISETAGARTREDPADSEAILFMLNCYDVWSATKPGPDSCAPGTEAG